VAVSLEEDVLDDVLRVGPPSGEVKGVAERVGCVLLVEQREQAA
jgi:hypothetical protein